MATYDREHGVLTWGGTLPGGEQWSNTLRMAETEAIGGIATNDAAGWDVQELLDHYTTVLQAHHENGGAMIANRAKLTFVKFNRVDVNGHYIDPTTFQNTFAAVSGGGSANIHPNHVCVVITLTTDVSRGPANKGRIFAPMPAIALGTDGLISVGDAQNLTARYRSLFEDLSDVPGIDTADTPGVCVMSKVGQGTRTRRVSGLRVGRVLDTQRRRRRSLPESYELEDVDQGAL